LKHFLRTFPKQKINFSECTNPGKKQKQHRKFSAAACATLQHCPTTMKIYNALLASSSTPVVMAMLGAQSTVCHNSHILGFSGDLAEADNNRREKW